MWRRSAPGCAWSCLRPECFLPAAMGPRVCGRAGGDCQARRPVAKRWAWRECAHGQAGLGAFGPAINFFWGTRMSAQNFDVIIVGAGVAGCAAAITAARGGLATLLLEKSATAGKMNLTGGRIYTYALHRLLPDFAATAPMQRRVTRERLSILTADAGTTVEYFAEPATAGDWAASSCTVLRKSLDPWLAEQAQKAGATLMLSTRVDDLLRKDGKYCGARTPKGDFQAPVVIIADGASSLLGQKLGLVPKPNPADYAVGAKEVIRLGEERVNERFNCSSEDGAAWLFLGYPSTGQMGGGFLYTNRDSVSLGMVLGLKDSRESDVSILQMLRDFKNHPLIRPLISGGEVISHGGHMVPEGGYNAMPELVGNGVLLIGDAASFCLNLGYTVRGMDLAILSGIAAANTVIRAKKADNFSHDYLWSYHDELEKENLLPAMKFYRHIPGFLHNRRIFATYPQVVNNFMRDAFMMTGERKPVWRQVSGYAQKVGFMNIMKDVWNGIKSF